MGAQAKMTLANFGRDSEARKFLEILASFGRFTWKARASHGAAFSSFSLLPVHEVARMEYDYDG